MHVIKRNGKKEAAQWDKITLRIEKLCKGLHKIVDSTMLSQKVIMGAFDGVTTGQLVHRWFWHSILRFTASQAFPANFHYPELKSNLCVRE